MTPTDIQNMVDHASKQSDRWMFILVLVVLVVGLIWDKWRAEKTLKGLFQEVRQDRKDSIAVIEENTKAHTRVLERLLQLSNHT
jgi:magnesium-transporting ATPase (P-type)